MGFIKKGPRKLTYPQFLISRRDNHHGGELNLSHATSLGRVELLLDRSRRSVTLPTTICSVRFYTLWILLWLTAKLGISEPRKPQWGWKFPGRSPALRGECVKMPLRHRAPRSVPAPLTVKAGRQCPVRAPQFPCASLRGASEGSDAAISLEALTEPRWHGLPARDSMGKMPMPQEECVFLLGVLRHRGLTQARLLRFRSQ